MRYQRAESPLKLDGLAAARDFFAGCLAEADTSLETLLVAHVDEDGRCLHVSRFPGSETIARMPVRQIIIDASLHETAGLILAHNHPSGDADPSESDCRATRRLATAAEALDCTVLDHLIFGATECTSMRQRGFL